MQFSSISSLVRQFFSEHEDDSAQGIAYDAYGNTDGSAVRLSLAEMAALNFASEQDKTQNALISQISDSLIAFAGANHVLSCIRGDLIKSSKADGEDGDHGVRGYLAFCDVHSEIIRLICDELTRRMSAFDKQYAKKDPLLHLDILIPRYLMADSLSHTPMDVPRHAKLAEQEVAQYTNNAEHAADDGLQHDEAGSHGMPYLTDDSPADIRNRAIPNGYDKVKLFAFRADESADTLGNIARITSDDLIEALRKYVFDFMAQYSHEFNRPIYAKRKGSDPVVNVLILLNEASDINHSLFKIAKYIATVWVNLGSDNSDLSMRQALGKSMYVLSMPSQLALFTANNLDDAKRNNYRKVIDALIKNRACLSTCSNQKGERLSFDDLLENYITNFCDYDEASRASGGGNASSSTSSASSSAAGAAAGGKGVGRAGDEDNGSDDAGGDEDKAKSEGLSTLEHARIKQYLMSVKNYKREQYQQAFAQLCKIEWEHKISKLFADSGKKKIKKSLWERTEEHFKNAKQNETEVISKEERDEISTIINSVDIASKSSMTISEADAEKLYTFVRNHQRIFNEDYSLLREWNNLIYSNKKYEDDNFMLSLTKCVLNVCLCESMQGDDNDLQASSALKTSYIELQLQGSDSSMYEKNYAAASYFSMRFGAYLSKLEKILPFKFFITGPNRQLPEYAGNEQAYIRALADGLCDRELSPVLNYDKFYSKGMEENENLKEPSLNNSISSDKLTFKFVLRHKSTGKDPITSHELTWTYKIKEQPFNLAANLREILNLSQDELDHPEKELDTDYRYFDIGRFKQNLYTITGEQAPLAINSPESFVLHDNGAITFPNSADYESTLGRHIYYKILDLREKSDVPPKIVNVNEFREYRPYWEVCGAKDVCPYDELCSTMFDEDDELTLFYKIERIRRSINAFNDSYFLALKAMHDSNLNFAQASRLADYYTLLQAAIISAMDDDTATEQDKKSLKGILQDVLRAGFAYDDASINHAIGTPFTVESMRSYTAKLERLCNIIYAAIQGELSLSQINMFIDSLESDMNYNDAPEICVSPQTDKQNQVLYIKEEFHGYALYESMKPSYSANLCAMHSYEYAYEILEYLNRYLKSRPYESDQCTLLIRDCRFPDIVVELYEALSCDKRLEDIKLTLLIVNDDMTMTAAISKRFEQLRSNKQSAVKQEEINSRIRVSILSSKDGLKAPATYSSYLDQHKLELHDHCMHRIADLSLLIHVFDERSTITFEDYLVPVISDEINFLPSLVNRNNNSRANSDHIGKFLVNQIQPLSRVQLFNSAYLCTQQDANSTTRFSDLQTATTRLVEQLIRRIDGKPMANIRISTYLPMRKLKKDSFSTNTAMSDGSFEDMLNSIHEHSDVVAFIDELQCRDLITNDDGSLSTAKRNDRATRDSSCANAKSIDLNAPRRLVYYSKLKDSRVNLLVSSSADRDSTERYLKRILTDTCPERQMDSDLFLQAVEKDALDISGSLLLRAEKRRKYTYELMGNVLSKFLMEQIISHLQNTMGLYTVSALPQPLFVSLDDYQSVFTGKISERADILCLHVLKYSEKPSEQLTETDLLAKNTKKRNRKELTSAAYLKYKLDKEDDLLSWETVMREEEAVRKTYPPEDNEYLLMVSVIESKFLQEFDKTAAKKSQEQALKSLKHLSMPFDSNFADRRQYLAKFADMISDNCKAKTTAEYDLYSKLQQLIRDEHIDLMFMGYSFVYAYNHVLENESDNTILSATMHPQASRSTKMQQVLQIRMQHNTVRDIFKDYVASRIDLSHTSPMTSSDNDSISTNDAASTHSSTNASSSKSSITLLERMLQGSDMQLFNQYLVAKGQDIHKLKKIAIQSPCVESLETEPKKEPLLDGLSNTETSADEENHSYLKSLESDHLDSDDSDVGFDYENSSFDDAYAEDDDDDYIPQKPSAGAEYLSKDETFILLYGPRIEEESCSKIEELMQQQESLNSDAEEAIRIFHQLIHKAKDRLWLEFFEKPAQEQQEIILDEKGEEAFQKLLHNAANYIRREYFGQPPKKQQANSTDMDSKELQSLSTSGDASDLNQANLTHEEPSSLAHDDSLTDITNDDPASASDRSFEQSQTNTTDSDGAHAQANSIEPKDAHVEAKSDEEAKTQEHAEANLAKKALEDANEDDLVKELSSLATLPAKPTIHTVQSEFKPLPSFADIAVATPDTKSDEHVAQDEDSDPAPQELQRRAMMDKFFSEHIKVKEYLDSCNSTIDFENPQRMAMLDEFIDKLLEMLKDNTIVVRSKRLTTVGGYVELTGGKKLSTKAVTALEESMLIQCGFKIRQVIAVTKALAVGVEFNDDMRITVPYEALLKDREFNYDTYTYNGIEYLGFNSRFMIGLKDDDGAQMYLDLREHAPHTLIAGGTGSGKSTLVKMMIMDMLLTNLPSELRLILIDPKAGIELNEFKDFPNVGPDNFPSRDHFTDCFNALVDEMEQRYSLMAKFRELLGKELGDDAPAIQDIDQYNHQMNNYVLRQQQDGNPVLLPEGLTARMQHIILIVDEFAEIIHYEGKNNSIDSMISRLGNKARAAGIYLILATQRPTVDVITGGIKANAGNRICMKVNNGNDTAIALGEKGDYDASKLAGKGHLIAKLGSNISVIQSGYMSESCLIGLRKAIRADYEGRQGSTKPTTPQA